MENNTNFINSKRDINWLRYIINYQIKVNFVLRISKVFIISYYCLHTIDWENSTLKLSIFKTIIYEKI